MKNNKICFIGHRYIFQDKELREKLFNIIKEKIQNGYKVFTMGTHGEFDKLVLSVCREIRNIFNEIEIEVVITSFKTIEALIEHDLIFGDTKYLPYKDVKTVMFDIEEEFFKRKIIASNQRMIDSCDTLVCYVDTRKTYGGAILAYKYAKKKGLRIINLFDY